MRVASSLASISRLTAQALALTALYTAAVGGIVKKLSSLTVIGVLVALASLPWQRGVSPSVAAPSQQNTRDLQDELKGFAALDPIDTHTHVFKNDPAFPTMLSRLRLHVLDICVFTDKEPAFSHLQDEIDSALAVTRAAHGYVSWCTTFDPFQFRSPKFPAETIQQLDRDFNDGAVAVKIWKNIGMELKTPDGKFVMPDDPVFMPIYRAIAARNKTLIAHLAEPDSCWQPLDPANPDYDYYKAHPEWYMYGKSDHPSKAKILEARDHLLAQNPELRVVGAHLGSMELDLDGLAQRFDRYPNFAVDTAARVVYLALQPRDKVRAFLMNYQDRVLYGTDLGYRPKGDSDNLKDWESTYLRDWKFFATNETVEFDGRKFQGLQLPDGVLRKLYHDNAVHWIPMMMNPAQDGSIVPAKPASQKVLAHTPT
jgi:predicted TIM-barrel fold metal-dependent hydrolase